MEGKMEQLKQKILKELGRAIGTTPDLQVWAGHLRVTEHEVREAMDRLHVSGEIRTGQNGLIYRSF